MASSDVRTGNQRRPAKSIFALKFKGAEDLIYLGRWMRMCFGGREWIRELVEMSSVSSDKKSEGGNHSKFSCPSLWCSLSFIHFSSSTTHTHICHVLLPMERDSSDIISSRKISTPVPHAGPDALALYHKHSLSPRVCDPLVCCPLALFRLGPPWEKRRSYPSVCAQHLSQCLVHSGN